MKQKIIILYASSYEMTDEKTGRFNSGVSLSYFPSDSLAPLNNENGSFGKKAAKGTMPFERFGKISTCPAVYEATFEMAVGKDGKPTLNVVDVDYVGAIDAKIVPLPTVK